MTKRVRAARHYQRKDSFVRALADKGKAALRRDMRDALKHLSSLVPRDRALHHARGANWAGLKRDINWSHFREVLKGVFARMAKIRQASAEYGAQKINGTFSQARRRVRFRKREYAPVWFHSDGDITVVKDIGDRFNFDVLDEATQDRIRQAQDDLIQQLEQDARDAIDQIILSGAREGLGPEDIVDDVRDMIGLTDRQAAAVMNYESMLRDLDPEALARQLRNTDYDAILQDAIDSQSDLAESAIESMVADYIDNYLDYRAATIAQTESVRASNEGLNDAYRQAIDRGALPEDAITRYWQIALDEKTCEICLSVVDQNPDGVGVNEDFDSIDGPQDAPPIHANCRCSLEFVTDLDKVPDES